MHVLLSTLEHDNDDGDIRMVFIGWWYVAIIITCIYSNDRQNFAHLSLGAPQNERSECVTCGRRTSVQHNSFTSFHARRSVALNLMADGWWTKGCRAIFIAACYIFDVLIWIWFFRTACQRLLRRRNSWVFGSMESTVSYRYESHISSTFVFFIICLPILVSYCCDCEHICNNNNNRKVKTTVNFLYPLIWIVIFVVWNNWRTTH